MHEMRLEETTKNLAQLRQNAPPIKAKGRVVFEYFQKDRFLEKERERYSVYVTILREKLARASSTIRCDAQIATTSSVNIAGKSQLNNGAIESVNEK